MKSIAFIFLLVLVPLILLLSVSGMSETIDRSFWDQAVAIAEQNRCLVPARIIETETVTDQKGSIVEENYTKVCIVQNNKNDLDIRLVLREENKIDCTKNFEKDFSRMKEEIIRDLKISNLFTKAAQPFIRLTGFEQQDIHAVYTFLLTLDGIEFIGHAKIDKLTGSAFYSKITQDKMKEWPYLITDFEEIMIYGTESDKWFPETRTQNMQLTISGLRSFKGNVKVARAFKEYFCNGKR